MHCVNCRESPISRPRRLCWKCFYDPAIRNRHPITSKFGLRGLANGNFSAPPAACPTTARPGSEEKIRILAERVRQGVSLWHEDDATLTDEMTTTTTKESDHEHRTLGTHDAANLEPLLQSA